MPKRMSTPEIAIRDALIGCGADQPGLVEVPEIMANLAAEGWEIHRSYEGQEADRWFSRYEPQITVYPVGLLEAIRHRRLKPWWWYVHGQAKRNNWRAIRNSFNGYLAEVSWGTMQHRRCGHGWTRNRALADLGRHLGELNSDRRPNA